jgi:hypothetical protein
MHQSLLERLLNSRLLFRFQRSVSVWVETIKQGEAP